MKKIYSLNNLELLNDYLALVAKTNKALFKEWLNSLSDIEQVELLKQINTLKGYKMSANFFQIDVNNVKSSATSFTITETDFDKYTGFAIDGDALVSFNGGSQAFPLSAGIPMQFPENITSIETDVAVVLYLGY